MQSLLKAKQKLYEKFLNNHSIQNEKIYNDYRKLFETEYYYGKLLQFQGDTKKAWQVMKEVIGKSKLIHSTLLRKIVVNKNDEKRIAKHSITFFITLVQN